MTRISRAATVIALALAFAAVPLVADWCAISCETAHSSATSDDAPACHHTSSPTPRIGHLPAPCGHEHHPVVVDSAATTSAGSRTIVVLPALAAEVALSTLRVLDVNTGDDPGLDPSAARLPLALSLTLRI